MARRWGFRQANSNIVAGGGSPYTIALTLNVLGGSLLICSSTCGAGAGGATFSDSLNGAWTATPFTTNDSTNNQSLTTSFFISSKAGAVTITVTCPNSTGVGGVLSEYVGIQPGVSNDVTKGANPTATTTPTTGLSAAVVALPEELVYGVCIEDTVGTAIITGTDVTVETGQNPLAATSGGVNVDIACGDKDGPLSGTTSTTFGFSASETAIVQLLTFKAILAGTYYASPGGFGRMIIRMRQ